MKTEGEQHSTPAVECDHAHTTPCPRCRGQLEADRELRQLFRSIAPTGPSLYFNRVLRSRLRAERQRLRRRRWRLLLMQGYWVAASVAGVIVMTLTRWPEAMPSLQVAFTIGVTFAIALLTPLILLRSLSIGPLGLIIKTMEAFRS